MYSYESVLDGLFDVLPISGVLKDTITEISELTSSESPDLAKLENLVKKVSRHESKLDSESAYFLKMAQITVNKAKCKGM